MQHPITKETYRVTLAADYDYLKAGVTYRATPVRRRSGRDKGKIVEVRFDQDDESAGTTLRPSQWAQLQRLETASIELYRNGGRQA
ncbi:MAG: hypothetical protein K2X76_01485 [Sphingomonas sp.]|nr:hypothetical protein [Sphingomonas sp.]